MTAFELYLKIGFNHILDQRLFTDILAAEGYDHLLFIIALAAIYKISEYKKVFILVTAFTLGHSITLVMSTFDIVSISMKLVEFLIPLTIVLTALFNLIKRYDLVNTQALRIRYVAALLFGFIHGLGFSNYLKALLGNEKSIIMPLIGFNVGLEVGQLIIVLFILLVFYILNKLTGLKRQPWIVIISLFVLALAIPILFSTFKALIGQ